MKKHSSAYNINFENLSLRILAIVLSIVAWASANVKAQNQQSRLVINDQLFINDDVESDSLIRGWHGGMTIHIDSTENGRFYRIEQPYLTTHDWDVQFAFVSEYDYQIGGEYTLEMDVRGSANTSLGTAFLALDDNKNYFNPGVFGEINVTTNWEHIKLTADCDLSPTQYIVSNIGHFLGTLNLDNIKVYCSAFYRDYDQHYDSLYYVRYFDDAEWQAIYVPFAMNYENWKNDFEIASIRGLKQYDIDGDGITDQTTLEIEKISNGDTKPNEPYLIRSLEIGSKTLALKDVIFCKTEEKSFCHYFSTNKFEIIGTYSMKTNKELEENNLYTPINGTLVHSSVEDNNLSPFRWYMSVTNAMGERQDVGIVQIKEIGQEMGITSIKINESHLKKCYTLDGGPAVRNTKGVVVKQDKVVFVR